MFKTLQSSLLALAVALNGVVPAYAAGEQGYYFRHVNVSGVLGRDGQVNPEEPGAPDPEEQSKDITARFIGGVGVPFSQALPLRSDWYKDSWRIVSGTLPAGLDFDDETKAFTGTPSVPSRASKVTMVGTDALGRKVASAEITFDIHELAGQVFNLGLYAHTGKYRFDQLPLPTGVDVDDWSIVQGPPAGMEIIGRNVEGTPEKAGTTPMFIQALDYRDVIVASYAINYVVEDGPTFPFVKDVLYPLNIYNYVDFPAVAPPRVNHAINGHDKVKYWLEVKPGDALPGTLYSNGDPKALRIEQGFIYKAWQQATIRWTARDVDGTVGEPSNWFKIGSTNPTMVCMQNQEVWMDWVTGMEMNIPVARPQGADGTLTFELTAGTLPPEMTLDPVNGVIKGTPATKYPDTPFTVTVTSRTGESDPTTTDCRYKARTQNGATRIVSAGSPQDMHVRIGGQFSTSLALTGGIRNFDWTTVSDPALGGYAFSTETFNSATVGIAAFPASVGTHTAKVKVANGDGAEVDGQVPVKAYDNLAFRTQPTTITIQKYESAKNWGNIDFDPVTIIPDAVNGTLLPSMTIRDVLGGQFPEGIDFAKENAPFGFYGMTKSPAGMYGPFTVTMSDASAETKTTDEFMIHVTERAQMALESLTPPVFYADKSKSDKVKPLKVVQPEGARALKIDYALAGDVQLPAGVSFDPATGEMTSVEMVPFEQVGRYGPYTVTATDSEGYSFTSAPFDVVVEDKRAPDHLSVTAVSANVKGSGPNETTTWAASENLRSRIDADTIYGTRDEVVFTGVEPSQPAGLDFNPATDRLEGIPKEEFDGTVSVKFKDIKNRPGSIDFQLKVLPYPTVSMSGEQFELPRLADAKNYIPAPAPVAGFWPFRAITWSLAEDEGSTPLPEGVTVDAVTGVIRGSTSVAEMPAPIEGIFLKAVTTDPSNNRLSGFTKPFSLKVVPRVPMTFEYTVPADGKVTWKLKDRTESTPYTVVSRPGQSQYSAIVAGSFKSPISYSIVSTLPPELAKLSMDVNGRFTGDPTTLGEWQVEVQAKDSDEPPQSKRTTLTLKSTLDGHVIATNTASDTSGKRLRVNQQFQVPADPNGIKVSNYVGDVLFSTVPAILPEGVEFSPVTGLFAPTSHFSANFGKSGNYADIYVDAKDSDDRGFQNPLIYRFYVFDRLEMDLPFTAINSGQFWSTINVNFPPAGNSIDDVAYTLTGDLPGTRVDAEYNAEGTFTNYAWIDRNGQRATTADVTQLPRFAIVFDPIARTLTGTPSKAGTFPLTLTAVDANRNAPLYVASTKAEYERASTEFDIVSTPAEAVIVSTDVTEYSVTQYAPDQQVDVTWNEAENTVSPPSYDIDGQVPGTLVHVNYDENGNRTGYSYEGTTTADAASLPADAILLDGKARTLKGMASRAGTYVFRIKAKDGFAWENDTAYTAPITMTVEAARAMAVHTYVGASETSSENVPSYTAQPTIRTVVANAAYGRPVVWTPVSENLPTGISAAKGADTLSFAGYTTQTGTFGGNVWKARDAVGREITATAVTMVVGQREQMALVTSANPIGLVVNTSDATASVTATKTAFGLPVEKADWTVTGTLPPGITYDTEKGRVVFKGTATVIGVYDNIYVTGRDSVGGSRGTATLKIAFRVITPEDAIGVEVADVVTKVNIGFTAVPTITNTYGDVVVTSSEVSGIYAGDVTLNGSTGALAGTFRTAGDKLINLRTTDETKRLTSTPVVVKVIPQINPVLPGQTMVEQGQPLSISPDVFNVVGTKSFAKGAGNWPEGLDVNPDTGAITFSSKNPVSGAFENRMTLASGTYGGLKIVASDTLDTGDVDSKESNAFAIVVTPIPDTPDIDNVASTAQNRQQLHTVGTAVSLVPKVWEKTGRNPWNYEGTRYEINKDLTAETGLSFDTTTGVISGIPTKPVIYTDMVITVISEDGERDATAPFWFAVQPKDAIAVKADQRLAWNARAGSPFTATAPVFENAYGNLTYAPGPDNYAGFGVIAATGVVTAAPGNNWDKRVYPITVRVTDAFGRTGSAIYSVTLREALSITAVGNTGPVGQTISSAAPTVVGLRGTAQYAFSDLTGSASAWSGNTTTGVVSGQFSSGNPGDRHLVTVTVTDSIDGATATSQVTFSVGSADRARYWRFQCTAVDTAFNAGEITLYNDVGTNVTGLASVSSANNYPGFPVGNLVDGNIHSFYSPNDGNPASMYVYFDFGGNPQSLGKVWINKRMSYAYHNCTGWNLQYSADKVNWTVSWADSYTGWDLNAGKVSYMSVKPAQ